MIALHRKLCLAYYHVKDIKAIELINDSIDKTYRTKVILSLAGKREVIYVKESPTYILRRMGEETKNCN